MREAQTISIIVLNFNGLHFLKQSLQHLRAIEYPNKEIIVVDNASTDGSLEYLKSFNDIKVIENSENLGYSKGKNIGARAASGKYLLLLDNDVILNDPQILNKVTQIPDLEKKVLSFPFIDIGAERTKEYGLFYTWYGIQIKPSLTPQQLRSLPEYIECGYPTGKAIFLERKLFVDEFGGYDERQPYYLDDYDLGMFAWITGKQCIVFNDKSNPELFVHLGVNNGKNIKAFTWRTSFFLSGYGISLLKNAKISTFLLYFPPFFIFALLKALKNIVTFKSLSVFVAFVRSCIFFILSLPQTIQLRKRVQKQRIGNIDTFMTIRRPEAVS